MWHTHTRARTHTLRARACAVHDAVHALLCTRRCRVEDESDTSIDRKAFSLRDMVEWGINHPTAATDTLLDFLAECREVTEFPVLFAVDGLNLLYEKTEYPLDGELLDAHQLSVPAAFHCLGDKGFKYVTPRMCAYACACVW
ncbi:hypothetical protein EON67_03160, partial [archaeon]